MEIITLLPLKSRLINHYKKIPTASISTQYRHLRNDTRFNCYGDYPLLAFVVCCAVEAKINISKSQIQRAVRTSKVLIGNRHVLANLLALNRHHLSELKSSQKQNFTKKDIKYQFN